MSQRYVVKINAGNVLELVGVACVAYGIDRLAGMAWAVVFVGVMLVVAAELIYGEHAWNIPLPHRPQPRIRLMELRQSYRVWRARRRWPHADRTAVREVMRLIGR